MIKRTVATALSALALAGGMAVMATSAQAAPAGTDVVSWEDRK